jgi:hypothetical protein
MAGDEFTERSLHTLASGLLYLICSIFGFFRFRSQRFLRFAPIISLVLLIIITLIPTPGSWSDIHSQWLPDILLIPWCLFIFYVSHKAFNARGALTKTLAVSGWVFSGFCLIDSIVFLSDPYTIWAIHRVFGNLK